MTTVLQDIMHTIAQSLLLPSEIILLCMIVASVMEAGGFFVECVLERRKFKANIPALLKKLNERSLGEAGRLIETSGLLRRQRDLLLTVLDNKAMSKASMTALAEQLLASEESRYQKSLELPEIICKLGPMFGLLGTLIPLGPGLLALGQGNVEALSNSMLVAFDTTICGIISAGVCYVVATIRRRWYNDYLSMLESIMESILEITHPDGVVFDELERNRTQRRTA